MTSTNQNFYELKLENDQLLKISEFVQFCIAHQKKDIALQVNNEGHCLTYCDVYDILDMFEFNSVKIITSNALETHNQYQVDSTCWSYWLKNISTFDFSYDYSWNEAQVFGCIYGRPSAPRLGIATHLAKYHDTKSLIRTKFDFVNEESRKLFDLQQLFSWDSESIDNIHLLDNQQYFGDQYYEKGKYNQGNQLSHLYKNFLIDIVAEPVCHGNSFYPTEKIVRAMLCRRPFIVMASANYLDYLHQLGFHSFFEFWDEDYDAYDGRLRYVKILNLIDKLSSKSSTEMLELYYAMTYQLDHNYKLIVDQSYNTKITQI
jgi:hypothetical protein